MKQLFWTLPLIGIFLLSFIVQAQDVPTITVHIDDSSDSRLSGVNVRSVPRGRIYGVLYDGDSLTVTGRSDFDISRQCTGDYFTDIDMWFRVDLQGIEGWVSRCAVQFSGDMESVPVVEPNNAVSSRIYICYSLCSQDELGIAPEGVSVVGATRFNIRVHEMPSTQSPVLEITSSPQVYVVGRTDNSSWVKVQYGEVLDFRPCYYCHVEYQTRQGWVARFLLNLPQGWEDSIPIIE
jgi:hypothetical protein